MAEMPLKKDWSRTVSSFLMPAAHPKVSWIYPGNAFDARTRIANACFMPPSVSTTIPVCVPSPTGRSCVAALP